MAFESARLLCSQSPPCPKYRRPKYRRCWERPHRPASYHTTLPSAPPPTPPRSASRVLEATGDVLRSTENAGATGTESAAANVGSAVNGATQTAQGSGSAEVGGWVQGWVR